MRNIRFNYWYLISPALALLALLAACTPSLPVTGGGSLNPNTLPSPSAPAAVVATVAPAATATVTAPTAAPATLTASPAPSATMAMSMPTMPPQVTPPAQGAIPATGMQQVSIVNYAFQPAEINVQAGTKVTWTNNDATAHTVTADNGAFDSGPIKPGATFSFVFSQPGTYSYHCSFHPEMVAKAIVSGTAAQAPAPASGGGNQTMNQTAPAQAGVQIVTIVNFAFSPASLTVPVGTKVRWINQDSTTHTVTADSGTFDSGPLKPGANFAVSFSQAGTYPYHCSLHPGMTGTIIVTGPASIPSGGTGSSSGGGTYNPGGSTGGGNMGGGYGGSGGYH